MPSDDRETAERIAVQWVGERAVGRRADLTEQIFAALTAARAEERERAATCKYDRADECPGERWCGWLTHGCIRKAINRALKEPSDA